MSEAMLDQHGLPVDDTGRWTFRRKARLLQLIADRIITPAEAQATYNISQEELADWQQSYAAGTAKDLRVSQTKNKRRWGNGGARHGSG
jgi:Protein of unknown function (DUF1153)